MKLDEFDSHVLDQKGINPQKFFFDNYGESVGSAANAEKFKIGIMKHLRYKRDNSEDGSLPPHRKFKVESDGVQVREKLILLSEDDMQDPATILKKMGLDPVQWELLMAEFDAKSWDATMKLYRSEFAGTNEKTGIDKRVRLDDEPSKHTNWGYNCKIRVEPTQSKVSTEDIKKVFEDFTPPKLVKYKYKGGDLLLEVNIPDVHLGMYASKEETGIADYNIEIATREYKARIADLLASITSYNLSIEKIQFPVGQDFFHVDTKDNTTTAGTRVDTDKRWKDVYKCGTDLLCWTVEQLRAVAPVDVFYSPGNHDELFSYFATLHLWGIYKDTEGVTVDIGKTPRKYRQYGLVALGYSHGREEGKRIDGIMQEEEEEMWGNTIFREFHINDKHQASLREPTGIKIRMLPSIAPATAWSSGKAFTGSVRMAEFFLWHKERGLHLVIPSVVI